MKREDFDIAAGIVDRMDRLEKTIFKLEEIKNKKIYKILATDESEFAEVPVEGEYEVDLKDGEIATVVFVQDILEYYINTLNLELDELRKNLDEI